MANELDYPIVLRPLTEEEGGGYVAFAPDLQGCIGDGETAEAALANVKSAILEWIDEAKRLKREIPTPNGCIDRATQERRDLLDMISKQKKIIESRATELATLEREVGEITHRLQVQDRLADIASSHWMHGIFSSPRAPKRTKEKSFVTN